MDNKKQPPAAQPGSSAQRFGGVGRHPLVFFPQLALAPDKEEEGG